MKSVANNLKNMFQQILVKKLKSKSNFLFILQIYFNILIFIKIYYWKFIVPTPTSPPPKKKKRNGCKGGDGKILLEMGGGGYNGGMGNF